MLKRSAGQRTASLVLDSAVMPHMKLYKYHAVNKNSLSSLARRRVWVPKPGTFNDPYDCAATMFQMRTVAEPVLFRSDDSNVIAALLGAGIIDGLTTKEQEDWIENMGVYSMSKRKKNRLMWAHYADQFRGFCLEYTFDDSSYANLIKVDYVAVDQTPAIDDSHNSMALIQGAARQKVRDWKYEKEYRWVVEYGDRYYDRPVPITGVIFGSHCNPEDITTIKELLGAAVNVRYVNMTPKSFGLTIDDDVRR